MKDQAGRIARFHALHAGPDMLFTPNLPDLDAVAEAFVHAG
ncbi:hypothetical protein ACFQU7_39260 [Pseudoroseomonas wenyumeiae]|nr:hypothetical protein [Pseudoroseomonas wenyumeiae]